MDTEKGPRRLIFTLRRLPMVHNGIRYQYVHRNVVSLESYKYLYVRISVPVMLLRSDKLF